MPKGKPKKGTRARRGGGKPGTSKRAATIKAILAYIEQGVPDTHACQAAGVHRSTWHRWKKASRALARRADMAHSKAVATAQLMVRSAFRGNWTAAMTWLERREPGLYGRVDRLKVAGDQEGEPIQHEHLITYTTPPGVAEPAQPTK